ncbi:MAG: sigma-70 family RNA polymerase sigma factor [Pseudomonadota bacterium]
MSKRDARELDRMLLLAGGGNEAAFRQFYELTAPTVLAILLRMLKDRFQAEDVLQDTMVIAWNKATDFDPAKAGARTWLTTIARRRALDLLRSRKRRDEVFRDSAADIRDVLSRHGDVAADDPESTATVRRLAFCFGELNSDAAICIQSAYLDGLTFAEIAARIDRSLGTVKSWIRRGVSKLKQCMQA